MHRKESKLRVKKTFADHPSPFLRTSAQQRRSLEGLNRDAYVSRSKEEGWPMARKNAYTVTKGDNYGGLIAGQINVNDDHGSGSERIISWLSPIDFLQKQEDVFHDAHSGTGQWFLDSKFSGIEQVGVAVVYCERKRQDVSSPVNLLASIWRQLVDNKPLAEEVLHLYDHTASRAPAKFQEVHSILVKEIERFRDIYIVIDALDELSSDCASAILKAVSTMTPATSRQVRILALSRFGPSVLSVASVMQITANGHDIKKFVENRFQQGISTSPSLSNRARDDRELRETLMDQICKKAGGLFLLARLFVETLKYKTNVHALRDAVQKLPRSINEQYKETWKRIEEQNIDHRNLALRILSWLSHAVRPLKVQELCHALATRTGEKTLDFDRLEAEDILVPCCHGFVAIDKKTQIIRLIHYSAQEYLDEQVSSLFPDAQAEILGTCLTYLSFDYFRRGRCTFDSFDSYGINKVPNGIRIAKWRILPERHILAFLRDPMLLESAAQAHDSDLLLLWTGAGEAAAAAANCLKKNLPFLVAGSFGLKLITATLLNGPGDFNLNTQYGWNNTMLLHEAVAYGKTDLATNLEGSRGKLIIDPLDNNGRTPLHYAAAIGRADLMELLLKHGADLTVKDKYQATTLHFSVMSAAYTKLTIERGDMLYARDTFHRTALHYAGLIRMRNKKVLKLLTKTGASLAIVDSFHKSAQKYIDGDYQDYEALQAPQWIEITMFYNGREMSFEFRKFALDECHRLLGQTSGEKEKNWSIVSDSDEEDFKPTDELIQGS
ncbi:MAG: hypothetical protein Q9226_002907 [Calogaya cf. arnoldii]